MIHIMYNSTRKKDTHLTVEPLSTFERGCHCSITLIAFDLVMIGESLIVNDDQVGVLDRSHLGAGDGNSVSKYGGTS